MTDTVILEPQYDELPIVRHTKNTSHFQSGVKTVNQLSESTQRLQEWI